MQSLLLYLQTFNFMKLFIFLALFTPFIMQSQTYEVGGYLGMGAQTETPRWCGHTKDPGGF